MKKNNITLIIIIAIVIIIVYLLGNQSFTIPGITPKTDDSGIKVTAKFYDTNGNLISTQIASLFDFKRLGFSAVTIPVEAVSMTLDVTVTNTGNVNINLVPRQVEYIWYQK